jgi:hypothetical protein
MSQTIASKTPRADLKHLMVWFDDLVGVALTDSNADEVAKWIGPNARKSKVDGADIVSISTNRGDVLLRVGDYITIDDSRRFKIVRIADADLATTAIKSVSNRVPKPSDIYQNRPNLSN